jgi:ABC-type ATPase with predicted acetyltransferase domain
MPLNQDAYYTAIFYDAEKRDRDGKGAVSRSFKKDKYTKEEADKEILRIRTEYKRKNLEYKLMKKKEKFEKHEDDKLKNSEKVKRHIVPPNMEKLPQPDSEINLKLDQNTGNSCVILGSSKMGKSTLLMYLYDKYFNTNDYISTLFTINAHINMYKDHKKLIICKTFNREAEKVIQMEKFINTKTDNKYDFVVMLDDIIDVRYSKLLNNLILTYRNSKISSFISLQYPKLLSKSARANINNIIMFNFNTDETCNDVIKLFLKNHFNKMGYKNEDEQLGLYKELTKNHGFIYLNTLHDHISFHRLII